MRDKLAFLSYRKNLKGTGLKLTDDATKEQRVTRAAFKVAYDNEWKADNSVRRVIRNDKMIIHKDGAVTKRYEIKDGKVGIMQPSKRI